MTAQKLLSQTRFLNRLRDEENLHLLHETVLFLRRNQRIYEKCADEVEALLDEEGPSAPPQALLQLLEQSGNKVHKMLAKLIAHSFPTLKSLDIGSGDGERVQINLQMGPVVPKRLKDSTGKKTGTVIDLPQGVSLDAETI